jgi:hypothetical protein
MADTPIDLRHLTFETVSEGVELTFIDLQLDCAYMYVCSKRGRTLSGRSSLKKMEDMIHE